MNDAEKVSRREFTLTSAIAMLNGVVITLTGCGDSAPSPAQPSPPPATTTSPAASGVEGVVSANHGHVAVITSAELSAGMDLTLDISGDAGHPHTVDLTAAELQQIASGVPVAKPASVLIGDDPLYADVETHGHTVTFN